MTFFSGMWALTYLAESSFSHNQSSQAMSSHFSLQIPQAAAGSTCKAWGLCCTILQSNAFLRSTELTRPKGTWPGFRSSGWRGIWGYEACRCIQ